MPSVGQCIGPYRLLRTLGAGGMGVVFEARHEETGQTVALKSVGIPEASAMLGLRREIQALSRLSHPDIVRVLDHGIVDGAPWFAMELLAGTSLRRHLELAFGSVGGSLASTQARSDDSIERTLAGSTWVLGRGTEPPASTTPDVRRAAGPLREALVVASRLCDPLAYLHGEGIVHRDLKPENVFLRPDGTPVLVDFGLQSGWATGVSRDSVSMAGQLGGSLRYMAPEQARGELVDARADLYALGCILYELLTGAPPFTAMSAPEMVWLHANAAPPPPSTHAAGISQALDELVLALLTKDPAARIGHASLVKRSLAGIAGIDLDEPAGALRPFLFRPAFVGRESDLAMIAERVDRARSGEDRCSASPATAAPGRRAC
ncbi:MAG: serine/threonine-protein kinase [Acidobacteriota bacterium]